MIKILLRRLYITLSLLYFIYPPISNGAYLVVPASKGPVEKEDYKEAWNIINQYSFPQRLVNKEAKDLNIQDEQQYIQNLINVNVNRDLRILFIPDTLYELYVMSVADNVEYNIFLRNLLIQTFPNEYEAFRLYKQTYFKYHKLDKVIDLSYLINENLVRELDNYIDDSTFLKATHYEDLINKFSKYFTDQQVNNRYLSTISKATNNKSTKKILYEVAKLQLEAHRKNEVILLRGSAGISSGDGEISTPDSPFRFKNKEDLFLTRDQVISLNLSEHEKHNKVSDNYSYSFSFGNSLFAGAFREPKACVFDYIITEKAKYGYYLRANKLDSSLKEIFYFAPVHPLLGLLGGGRYFHPRTKHVVLDSEDISFSYKEDMQGYLYVLKRNMKEIIAFYTNLETFFQQHFHLLTFKGTYVEENTGLALKIKEELDAQIQRDFDLLLLSNEHIAKQRKLNSEINNHKKK